MMAGWMKSLLVLAVVFALVLVPLSLVDWLINDRTDYHEQAVTEISASWTGAQTLIGPLLVIEYATPDDAASARGAKNPTPGAVNRPKEATRQVVYVPMQSLETGVELATELRYRGIHKAPVYTANLSMTGQFDETLVQRALAGNEQDPVTIERAWLWIWISDHRGFARSPTIAWDGAELQLEGGGMRNFGRGGVIAPLELNQLVSGAFKLDLQVRGSGALKIVPTAESVRTQMTANWAHPKFVGRYLPTERAVDAQDGSFSALWTATALSSNVGADLHACARASGACSALEANHFGVELINPVDQYLLASRASKYGILFLLLVFGGVLITELQRQLRVHPLQYLMVGASMAMFFLLLLSLAEHLPFAAAYTLASLMSGLLLTWYGVHILASRRDGLVFGAGVFALFGLLFVILGREDTALLLGTMLTFGLLAGLMYVTRNTALLDRWQSALGSAGPGQSSAD